MWEWYFDIDQRVTRVRDGLCSLIPPSEWLAWKELTGHVVYRWEFAILTEMDVAYSDALNKELADKRARDADVKAREIAKGKTS